MSLFNRPAWAKQDLSDDDEDQPKANIFSHSGSYRDIVEEREQRKREKAKKKAKTERRSSGKRDIEDEPNGDSTPKQRRITSEETGKLLGSLGLPARSEKLEYGERIVDGVSVRRSSRKRRNNVKPAGRVDEIDLGGSSDEAVAEDLQTTPAAKRTKSAPQIDEIQEDSDDDEFAELARKARQQRERTKERTPRIPHSDAAFADSSSRTNHDRPPDPVVQLLITSTLPGTKPLIVQRKLSQPTGAVRHAWCQKQGFSREYTEKVYLVHRMRRIYDVTTCRSLGLEVDQAGNLRMRGAEGKEDVDKVHLEAVTEEVFKQMKEYKEKDARGDAPAEGEEGAAQAPAKEESLIRVTLKAKGQNEFKLKVKANTPISKIASAYAKSILGDPLKQVRLEFDGEELSPDNLVQDTEIEDMVMLEVHVI